MTELKHAQWIKVLDKISIWCLVNILTINELNKLSDFYGSLPMMLYRALDDVMPAYRELFSRYNLTEQQWRVLRVIWESKTVTSAALSEKSLLSPPSLVKIIDKLEKKELVTRVRSIEDRRQIYVIATANGRALQQEVIPQVTEIHDKIRNNASEEEWKMLELILNKLTSNDANTDAVKVQS